MKVRLVVSINAAPGKGAELAQAFRQRCADVAKEPGCEQFEVFQSVVNPDKLTLLERWTDQASLDAHAQFGLGARMDSICRRSAHDGTSLRKLQRTSFR